TAIRKCNPRT
nr:RecName: Full=Toxin To37; AltName: Full=Toxin Tc37 [Tityus obscurus]